MMISPLVFIVALVVVLAIAAWCRNRRTGYLITGPWIKVNMEKRPFLRARIVGVSINGIELRRTPDGWVTDDGLLVIFHD